ncbi:MAG: hypothetical protein MZV70_42515 [Desulfobacterales bacterium]|nr:hypothetical protein [Desulfobacterales bacterium]
MVRLKKGKFDEVTVYSTLSRRCREVLCRMQVPSAYTWWTSTGRWRARA